MRGAFPGHVTGGNTAQRGAGRGALGVDGQRQPFGVVFVQQAFNRDLDKVGVAEVGGAIPVGPPHGLGDEMRARHGIEPGQIIAGQDIQHLPEHNAARGRRRGGTDPDAVVFHPDRRAFGQAVVEQVPPAPETAMPVDALRQLVGKLAAVEGAAALFGDHAECVRQIFLHDPLPEGGDLPVP